MAAMQGADLLLMFGAPGSQTTSTAKAATTGDWASSPPLVAATAPALPTHMVQPDPPMPVASPVNGLRFQSV